jgi:poly(3-hydroxyalkanoate) synthetase
MTKRKKIEVWGTCMGGTFVAGIFKARNRPEALKKAIKKCGIDYTYYTVGNKKDYYTTINNDKIEKRSKNDNTKIRASSWNDIFGGLQST